jgi:serine/threonine-protein kinase
MTFPDDGPPLRLSECSTPKHSREDGRFAALLAEVADAPEVALARVLAPGSHAGEYELVVPIGHGGFGTVYRAVHRVLRTEAAVKVLGSRHSADPCTAKRFVEEARAIHRIRHPNIIDLFGFGELASGELYYAMELLAGRTLHAELAVRGAFEPPLALSVLRQVAAALDAAHGHGVLHRDLKPENIFVVGELSLGCRIKLLDFGIAKLLSDESAPHTRTGTLIGTPGYMSPEQCAGEVLDTRSDIYTLGVIAYELLTGQRLFQGTGRELMARHMFEVPPRASQAQPGLPRQIDELLLAMLHKRPGGRPLNACVAIEEIGEAVAARMPGPSAASLKKRAQRARSARWILAGAVALAAAAVARQGVDVAPLQRNTAMPAAPAPAAQVPLASSPATPAPSKAEAPVLPGAITPAAAHEPAPTVPSRASITTSTRGIGARRPKSAATSSGRAAAERARRELEF